jgi:colanic acid biosynthesis glycosyl transferase WcaI
MRILVVTQYFWPENFRVNDLTAELVRRGHEVTVLTGLPNYPAGKLFPGYGWAGPYREKYAGARIVRVPIIPRGAGGGFRLTLNFASFAVAASVFGLFRLNRGLDAIFVHEPSPITVGLPAIVAKRLTGAPILFWVLDLWPESVSATGAVRSPRVLAWIAKLVRFIYRHCDRLLLPSRAFIPSVLASGGNEYRIRYFPNWAEPLYQACARIVPPPAPLPHGFRLMFAGNVGAAQDFPSILKAAEQLKLQTHIHWIILGDGRLLDWVKGEVTRRSLGATVHLFGQHPVESMPAFFAHADAMLVTLRRDPIFALTIPAKVQAYLSCGRPVIGMLDGEGARVIEEAKAGLAVSAGDAEGLAAAVLKVYNMNAAERERLGAHGLTYSRAEFARETLFDRLERYLLESTEGQAQSDSNASSPAPQKKL